MNDLGKFLTSQEIIIVYIIAALACLICFIVYLIEKNNENIRRKHNTKKLNKLVDEIRNTLSTEEKQETYSATVDIPVISSEPILINTIDVDETVDLAPVVEEVQKIEGLEEELEYTSIEPDQETARIELQKMQEQLEKDEQLEPVDVVNAYEEEQEKTAIISLDELLKKSKEMYESNEVTQYQDEGNEPISIQDLEIRVNKQAATYDEPFIISNVVSEEELQANINEAFEEIEVLNMDDFNTIKPETVNPVVTREQQVPKFQCSPIISPIFGIEHDVTRDNVIALENTANYDKLDQEIRASSDYYMSLAELQNKIE